MTSNRTLAIRAVLILSLVTGLSVLSIRTRADCDPNPTPFTDLASASPAFCQAIAAAYFSGLTLGTSPTTFSPTDVVDRQHMVAFITRTLDQSLVRGNRRTALKQSWITRPQWGAGLGTISIGQTPRGIQSDGTDVWVASDFTGTVARVRGSDARLLETWSGISRADGVLVALSRVFVSGSFSEPGPADPIIEWRVYMIDPSRPPEPPVIVASSTSDAFYDLAFDGEKIWALSGTQVSVIIPGPTLPWTEYRVFSMSGLEGNNQGILFDGSNIWVLIASGSPSGDRLLRFDANGVILQTVTLPADPGGMVFDGINIWVTLHEYPYGVAVVRASTGAIVTTIQGNGLSSPLGIGFDGERILVINGQNDLLLWKANDLSFLGRVLPHGSPFRVCSDGLNFWFTLPVENKIARF
jgi:hypothetical protein